jgi:hypothetical protein
VVIWHKSDICLQVQVSFSLYLSKKLVHALLLHSLTCTVTTNVLAYNVVMNFYIIDQLWQSKLIIVSEKAVCCLQCCSHLVRLISQWNSDTRGKSELPWITRRGLQRDVVYLGWPIAPLYMSPNKGGGGSCGVSANETAVHRSPNKLWRSNSIFNLWSPGKGGIKGRNL